MRSQHHKLCGQLLNVAALALGLLALALPARADGLKKGDRLPDLASFGLEGQLPSDLTNKVVLLDFWASWCGPCRLSFPVMEELHQRYGSRGLVVVAVSVDEKRGEMDAFLKTRAVGFSVLRDAGQKLVEKIGATTMPTSILVGRDGKARFIHAGFYGVKTKKEYEQEIESLLAAR
jgi:thiol-disulfide isomerase/thioredoxin